MLVFKGFPPQAMSPQFLPPLPLQEVSRWKEADGRVLTSIKRLVWILISNTLLQGRLKRETMWWMSCKTHDCLQWLNDSTLVFLYLCYSLFFYSNTRKDTFITFLLYYYKRITFLYIASQSHVNSVHVKWKNTLILNLLSHSGVISMLNCNYML